MTDTRPSPVLRVRKLADKTEGERVVRFDPVTGERKLVNPYTAGDAHEAWPLAGVQVEGDAPAVCSVSTSFVSNGIDEGWIELVNARPAHRPGGPPTNEWKVTHTFMHADAIVLKTVDGDVRYQVTRQPDKYVESTSKKTDPKTGSPIGVPVLDATVTPDIYAAGETTVMWSYDLEMEG